jgi:hypothetical protein
VCTACQIDSGLQVFIQVFVKQFELEQLLLRGHFGASDPDTLLEHLSVKTSEVLVIGTVGSLLADGHEVLKLIVLQCLVLFVT